MANSVTWQTHQFSVHQHGDSWNAVGGLYIFAGLNSAGRWVPVYIGQAESLADRIPNHERWQEASRLGATHVHAKVVQAGATRDTIEGELCRAFQPRLNVQLK